MRGDMRSVMIAVILVALIGLGVVWYVGTYGIGSWARLEPLQLPASTGGLR